jgi:anti-sigma factor RsiW
MASHPKTAHLRFKQEREKASAELSDARAELSAATSNARALDLIAGGAIANWIAAFPKVSAESVHREMVAADQERRRKIATGETPAPSKAAPIYMSALDEARANTGKGDDINRRLSVRPRPLMRMR